MWGGGGVAGGLGGGALLGRASTSGRLRTPVSLGGYPFEAKKGSAKWWRIWRGVPVLTTYTPSARGLGGFALQALRDEPIPHENFSLISQNCAQALGRNSASVDTDCSGEADKEL